MNLEEIRAVQADERGTDSLQSLPDSFYRDVAAYIEDLREERERAAERADDPFSSEEVRRLTDEIEAAEEVVEAVYERRIGKVVKRASLAAAGMPADDEGLTDEEAELFSEFVDLIEANRAEVLDAIAGGAEPTDGRSADARSDHDAPEPADPPPTDDDAPELGVDDAMGGSSGIEEAPPDGRAPEASDVGSATGAEADPDDAGGPTEAPAEAPVAGNADAGEPTPDGSGNPGDRAADPGGSGGRVTLRITRDVGEVFGVDERVYDLASEDVVTLPEENAEPLLDRDAAQRLD